MTEHFRAVRRVGTHHVDEMPSSRHGGALGTPAHGGCGTPAYCLFLWRQGRGSFVFSEVNGGYLMLILFSFVFLSRNLKTH